MSSHFKAISAKTAIFIGVLLGGSILSAGRRSVNFEAGPIEFGASSDEIEGAQQNSPDLSKNSLNNEFLDIQAGQGRARRKSRLPTVFSQIDDASGTDADALLLQTTALFPSALRWRKRNPASRTDHPMPGKALLFGRGMENPGHLSGLACISGHSRDPAV